MLSPEPHQFVVAQGSTKLDNPSALTSYYGYDNDVVNAAGEPQMIPTPTTPDEATKTEPDKNTSCGSSSERRPSRPTRWR